MAESTDSKRISLATTGIVGIGLGFASLLTGEWIFSLVIVAIGVVLIFFYSLKARKQENNVSMASSLPQGRPVEAKPPVYPTGMVRGVLCDRSGCYKH